MGRGGGLDSCQQISEVENRVYILGAQTHNPKFLKDEIDLHCRREKNLIKKGVQTVLYRKTKKLKNLNGLFNLTIFEFLAQQSLCSMLNNSN